jgi:hypothetical protein
MMAVNTAKQKCPVMSIGSQQSAGDVTTEVAATEFIPAGSGSVCWKGAALVAATIIGLDAGPVAIAIGIVCAVHTTNR